MLNENAQKWVEALESSNYAQTGGRLRSLSGGFCCLGVACEVYNQNVPADNRLPVREYGTCVIYGDRASDLPEVVQDWLELRSATGEMPEYYSLAELNDGGDTFARIAEIIKSEPEGLFRV